MSSYAKKTAKATSATKHFNLLPHPEPIRTYKTTIHGQEVEVKVYPADAHILDGIKEGYHA
jgi:hypothetical protein